MNEVFGLIFSKVISKKGECSKPDTGRLVMKAGLTNLENGVQS